MNFLIGALFGGIVDALIGDDSIVDGILMGGIAGEILKDEGDKNTITLKKIEGYRCKYCKSTVYKTPSGQTVCEECSYINS
jgi:hypothetical protein